MIVLGLALAAILLVVLLPVVARPAQAQATACATRAQILTDLKASHGEVPAWRGVATGSVVMEVLASPDGRTWTLIVTYAHGLTCLLAVGEDSQQFAPPKGQPMRYWPAAHGTDWISLEHPGCCGEKDCDLIPPSHVAYQPADDSWNVMWGGRVQNIAKGDERLKQSKDGRFWVCEDYDKVIRCLFAPQAGA